MYDDRYSTEAFFNQSQIKTFILNQSKTETIFSNQSQAKNPIRRCMYSTFPDILIYALVIACLSLIANTIVIYLYVTARSLRRHTSNLILVSFAANDILAGLTILFHAFPFIYFSIAPCDSLGTSLQYMSDVAYVCSSLAIFCSVGHLIMLSTDRLLALFYALHYDAFMTKQRITIGIILVWIFSILLSSIELNYYKKVNKVYISATVIIFLIIPSFLLLLQYIMMMMLVNRLFARCPMQSAKQKLKTNRRALIIYGLMFLCFLFLSLPFFVVRMLYAFSSLKYGDMPQHLTSAIFLMRYITSLSNPMLYTFFKHDFRKAVQKWIKPMRKKKRGATLNMTQQTDHSVMLLDSRV